MNDMFILMVGCGVSAISIASALLVAIAKDHPDETRS